MGHHMAWWARPVPGKSESWTTLIFARVLSIRRILKISVFDFKGARHAQAIQGTATRGGRDEQLVNDSMWI